MIDKILRKAFAAIVVSYVSREMYAWAKRKK